jgi:hypothetical protein
MPRHVPMVPNSAEAGVAPCTLPTSQRQPEHRHMKALLSLSLAWVLSSTMSGAQAQSLRCKGDFASVGDNKASILQKCSEPMLRDAFCAAPTPAGGKRPERPKDGGRQQGCVDVDEWTYNPGYGQFLTTLRFENGKVVSIEYGDRVK